MNGSIHRFQSDSLSLPAMSWPLSYSGVSRSRKGSSALEATRMKPRAST